MFMAHVPQWPTRCADTCKGTIAAPVVSSTNWRGEGWEGAESQVTSDWSGHAPVSCCNACTCTRMRRCMRDRGGGRLGTAMVLPCSACVWVRRNQLNARNNHEHLNDIISVCLSCSLNSNEQHRQGVFTHVPVEERALTSVIRMRRHRDWPQEAHLVTGKKARRAVKGRRSQVSR